jgi:hypothetical protein
MWYTDRQIERQTDIQAKQYTPPWKGGIKRKLKNDLQGSDPNVEGDTSSQYGDHFCEIVVKSDFK